MNTAKRGRFAYAVLVVASGLSCMWGMGCDGVPRNGECSDDEDLQDPGNYYDGAICKDGHAACPDGRPICSYFGEAFGTYQPIQGCVGPCIECPPHHGICIQYEARTREFSYLCVDRWSHCWGNAGYIDLEPPQERCPAQDPSCW